MAEVVVFGGPSLMGALPDGGGGQSSEAPTGKPPDRSGDGRLPPGFQLRPPARRGDVFKALVHDTHTLVLLDGYYFNVGAVTHKELLYALDSGVRLIGAASMGALRAAELAAYGMDGVGTVFEWYRTEVLDGDDEVAVLHGPREMGYAPLTVALVEVRFALAGLEADGAVEPGAADTLLAALKALPFQERTLPALTRLAERHLGPLGRVRMMRLLARTSVKERDARRAIDLAATPARPSARVERHRVTSYTTADLERHMGEGEHARSLLSVWHSAQVLHSGVEEIVSWFRVRYLLASCAARLDLPEDAADEADVEEALRRVLAELEPRKLLAPREIREEARVHSRAAQAISAFGGVDAALHVFAARLGIESADPRRTLVHLVQAQRDHLPPWWAARCFAFSRGFTEAAALAEAAAEVHACFRRWARGARIDQDGVLSVAAALWSCPKDDVIDHAARRGLFDTDRRSSGLRDAIGLVAAAERLDRPINRYPELKQALRSTTLGYRLPLPRGGNAVTVPEPVVEGPGTTPAHVPGLLPSRFQIRS